MTENDSEERRCWCDHLKRCHSVAGVCRWCAKMELRHPQFNFMPRHAFATEILEELRRQAAEAVDTALRGSVSRIDPGYGRSR